MNAPASRLSGRPKDLEKRAAIFAAASGLFLEQGFERTTVDAIAAAAGVSKLTVYSHFADKEGLFKALISAKCAEHFEAMDFVALAPLGPAAALDHIARAFLALMFHPDVLALHRILMTNERGDTVMNTTFWQAGPQPTIAALAALLARFAADGALLIERPVDAADQFFSMLKGTEHLRMLLGIGAPPTTCDLAQLRTAVVAMFVRAYAGSAQHDG